MIFYHIVDLWRKNFSFRFSWNSLFEFHEIRIGNEKEGKGARCSKQVGSTLRATTTKGFKKIQIKNYKESHSFLSTQSSK